MVIVVDFRVTLFNGATAATNLYTALQYYATQVHKGPLPVALPKTQLLNEYAVYIVSAFPTIENRPVLNHFKLLLWRLRKGTKNKTRYYSGFWVIISGELGIRTFIGHI